MNFGSINSASTHVFAAGNWLLSRNRSTTTLLTVNDVSGVNALNEFAAIVFPVVSCTALTTTPFTVPDTSGAAKVSNTVRASYNVAPVTPTDANDAFVTL